MIEHAAITHLSPELNRNHAAPNINAQWQPILFIHLRSVQTLWH